MSPRKRQTTSNIKKEPEEIPSSSAANTSANANNDENSSQAAPPNKRMNLDLDPPVPVGQEKQPEPANTQSMNVLVQMQDFAKTMENCNQFKKTMERIQKHGTHNFMITNEFAEKMKEICERMGALNAMMPDSVKIQPIRKRIQLILRNCREMFTKYKFPIESNSIGLVGFTWYLAAVANEEGFLGLYLHAEPPYGFKGNYQIEVDYRFSILNALADKDLIRTQIGRIYTINENNYTGWGFTSMAKFEYLLDPSKRFLTPEGNIETWVDFTIKSSTLNHLI